MKLFRKLLPALLLVLLVALTALPVFATETYDAVVYVDNVKGNNKNNGLTEATAVKTMYYAYYAVRDALKEKGLDTDPNAVAKIVFVSDYTYRSFSSTSYTLDFGPENHVYRVVMEGKTPQVSLQFYLPRQCYLGMVGPTTFQNLNIRISDDSSNPYLSIHGRGGSLIIGEGVTTTDNPDKRPTLVGGPTAASSVNTYLEVNSGDWRYLYGGTYNKKLSAGSKLVMNGGSCLGLSATYSNTVTGNVEIIMNGGTATKFYGTTGSTGVVGGNLTVTLNGGTITGEVSPTGVGKVNGTKTVTLAGDDMKLTHAGEVYLSNITASKLNIGSATKVVFSEAFTGPVAVNVDKAIRYDYAYVTAPSATAEDAFTFAKTMTVTDDGTNKVWKNPEDTGFTGLVLKAPKEFTFTLYAGTGTTTKVTPDKTETVDGVKYQYYANIVGSYCYVTKRTGYYTLTKILWMSEEKSLTETVVDASSGKRDGIGWEPNSVKDYSDELHQTGLVDNENAPWWEDYSPLLVSPYFTDKTRAEHRATTQKEMEDFIASLDGDDDNMYIYSLGTSSKYGQNIPLVIFTKLDLSQVDTLEEAAALIRAEDKAIIHYQAQIHGNEPAGGEAALNQIARMDSAWGDGLLDTINVVIIPRINPDGAKDYTRANADGVNLNRDMVLATMPETDAIRRVCDLFEPDVNIDGHEYTWTPDTATGKHVDLQVSSGCNGNYSDEFIAMSEILSRNHYDTFYEYGMQPGYYATKANSYSAATNSGYHSTRGTLHLLYESRGIGGGNYSMARRVAAHLVVNESVFEYVAENYKAVMAVVDAERERFATIGATYEEEDFVNLQFKEIYSQEMAYDVTQWNNVTGEFAYVYSQWPIIYREAKEGETRTRPTAYVFPAGETWTQDVLDCLDANSIRYYSLTGDKMLKLRQLIGVIDDADLAPEAYYSFPNGCYVVPMNQPYCLLAAYVFEPDIIGYNPEEGYGSLTQMEIIPSYENAFPVYHYVHDLEADGTVATYTGAPAPTSLTVVSPAYIGATGGIDGLDATKTYAYRKEGAAEFTTVTGVTQITDLSVGNWYIRYVDAEGGACQDLLIRISYDGISEFVVYVDSTNGADTNSGYQESAPVATIEAAVARLTEGVASGAEGATGKVIFLANYELGTAAYTFPAHSFPITYTGKTGDIELIKGGGTGQAEGSVNVNGPSTFEYITLTLANESTYGNFNCRGFKTTMGKGLTCKANAKGKTFMLAGGNYSGNCASTDMTVLSGDWNMIYAGGYRNSVEGDVKLTVNGASLAGKIMASFTGGVTGNITYDISNVDCNGIYLGTAQTQSIGGNITATLREGVNTPFVYAGNRDSGTVVGTSYIIVEGADLTNAEVYGTGEKAAATVTKSVLTINSGKVGTVSGFDEVINNVNSGTVYLYQGTTLVETFGTFAKAAEAAAKLENSFLKLGSDVTETTTIPGGILVDLAGYSLSGITVDGTIYGMDSTTDGYEGDKVGTLTLAGGTVAADVKTTAAQIGAVRRYLAIPTDDGYTFHRFYSAITHITLNVAQGGIGYKATFAGDEAVRQYVASFGMKLALTEDFQGATEATFTQFYDKVVTKTVLLEGIFKKNLTEDELAERAAMVIYAAAFVTTEDGETITSDHVAYSLQNMVEAVDSAWDTLDAQMQKKLTAFYTTYQDILSKWNLHFGN